MRDLAERIADLSPEKRRLLEERLLGKRAADREEVSAPIPRRAESSRARLSFAQQRLWFLHKLEGASSAYHIPLVLRVRGRLDVGRLERALTRVTRRHESLRTVLREESGEPYQRVLPSTPVKLDVFEVPGEGIEDERSRAIGVAREWARRPFELSEGPLLRLGLLRLSEEEHWLVATFHHIVSDGSSLGVFQEELTAGYEAQGEAGGGGLEELPLQYGDYAEWQRERLGGEALRAELQYWRERLEGTRPALDLAGDRPRRAERSFRGARRGVVLSRKLHERLEGLARSHEATLYMVMLAALNVFLSRYTGQKDISVGSPVAGRTRADLEKLIGVFINTLVLRTNLAGDPSFLELLGRVQEVTLGALSHQEVPFEKLVEELRPERELSHSPLFQVMLVLQNQPLPPARMGGLEVERAFVDIGTAMFDLTFFVSALPEGLGVSVEYATELFDGSTVERMLSQLERLLESVVEEPGRCVWDLEMLPRGERERLLVEWNETEAETPRESCVHELIAAQAERTPERPAVSFKDASLSYAELEERSNRFARHLVRLGVGEESRVGVYVERSLEMVVGLLGVLKAGGAYVPLDPSFPRERLAFMIRDSGARVLLSQESLLEGMPEHEAEVVLVDGDWEEIGRESGERLSGRARGESLAYVLYTSGSTGVPKGVEVEHRALVNFLGSMRREPGMKSEDCLLAVTTLSFDIAGLELYLPLIVGGRVQIATREQSSDGRALAEGIETSGASLVQATPATWRMLLDSGWKGNRELKVLCGGESLPQELAEKLHERCGELWNLYGPTETTIWSMVKRMERDGGPVTVGRPIANTKVYVLDERAKPSPMGVPGELYIGGEGLARGYHERADLTAERFLSDPFAERSARMYRTGDLARYRENGEIQILGRLDDQVKVRGFRIELGEVESALASHPGVRQSVVAVREDALGDERLVGYIVPEGESVPDVVELREHLGEKLPEYMVPGVFVELEELPLTPNGKVDREALRAPGENRLEAARSYVAPRTEAEQKMAVIWQEVLGVERVGIHDDFFELGGHSLMSVRLFARLEDRLGVRLPLAILFRASTIAKLQHILRDMDEAPSWSCLVPIQRGDGRPPIFCIHAEGGEVLFYRDFAALLGPDQPVYGIQALGLDGKQPPLDTIEDMARHYIGEIRRVQPEGPYFLGGHCYGGVIMYEMAQQLHRDGESVALLAMMDSSPARIRQSLADKLGYGLKALSKSPFGLLHHILFAEIGGRLRRTMAGNGAGEPAASATHARVGAALTEAYLRYEPKPYSGRITYFMNSVRARTGHVKWRELAREFEFHVFPGTPNTTFQSPSVEVLARKVRSCLDAALESAAGRGAPGS